MKSLTMKSLSRLAKPLQKFVLGLLTLTPLLSVPLLTVAPTALAAEAQEVEFSQAELDQMLAPIALYPDALLSQVLIASTYPLEIIQADRWVRSNKDLKTEDALKFAESKDWDPSVKALVAFPDILHRLSDDVDWTQRLGDAFLSNEDQVMDAVQRLRKRAYATGNLDKAQHIRVERDDNYIIIEPAEERVVYVPVYDTRVVYGNWWWPAYPPVYWHYPSSYNYVSGFYWGTSIYLGPTYFYSSCHWRDRRVVVIDHHNHYNGNTRFYTGRSIVHYEGSRQWRHDPVHRHGVAYYNNNLRETYGSRHDSIKNDRDYREQHRDMSRLNRDGSNNTTRNPQLKRGMNDSANSRDDQRRIETTNGDATNPRHYDRSEQLRERLIRTNNGNSNARPAQDENNANRDANRNISRDNMATSDIRAPSQVPRSDNAPSNTSRPDAGERNRAVMQQRQMEVNNTNDSTQINQARRIVSDSADRRPHISAQVERTVERALEQRTNTPAPQPRTERQQAEAPRRVEFSPPRNDSENRAQPRIERQNNSPRISRDKNDDNDTK